MDRRSQYFDFHRLPAFLSSWRRVVLGLVLTYAPAAGWLAAQQPDFNWYDQRTYALYEAGDWKALSRLGREALANGYDYYYLRMRLGIANYKRERYRQAAPHFAAALSFNKNDAQAAELLYYSYLYGGQLPEARLQAPENLRPAAFHLLALQAEAGRRRGPDANPIGDLYYYNGGFSHTLGPRLTFTHQVQYLEQRFPPVTVPVPRPGGNGPGPGEPPVDSMLIEPAIHQHEYFLGVNIQFQRGWSLATGWHSLWVSDTIGHYQNAVYAVSLTKDWPLASLTATAALPALNGYRDPQFSFEATLFPLRNTSLVYTAAGTFIPRDRAGSDDYFLHQQLAVRLFKNAWLTGYYGVGDISKFSEYTGLIVYNFDDQLRERYGMGLQYWIAGRHLIYLQYGREYKNYWADGTPFRQSLWLAGINLSF